MDPGEEPWDRCAAGMPRRTMGLPYGEDPSDGWHREQHPRLPALRQHGSSRAARDLPLRTTSIEAELRAVMAERREAEAEAAPKRRAGPNARLTALQGGLLGDPRRPLVCADAPPGAPHRRAPWPTSHSPRAPRSSSVAARSAAASPTTSRARGHRRRPLERHELTAGTTWHAAGLITSAGMPTRPPCGCRATPASSATLHSRRPARTPGSARSAICTSPCTPQRLETRHAARRSSSAALGVTVEMVGGRGGWPQLSPIGAVDDILAAAYVADEGRANPAGVATGAIARAPPRAGVDHRQGRVRDRASRPTTARVTAVDHRRRRRRVRDRRARGRLVVARARAAARGIDIPLQAAEHYYLLTAPFDGVHRDLPVSKTPTATATTARRAAACWSGCSSRAAPWSLDGSADLGFAALPPDWDRMARFLSDAMDRFPSLHDAGIRQFFCGRRASRRTTARCSARCPSSGVLRRVRAELARHPAVGRRGLDDRASGSSTASRRSRSRGSRRTGSCRSWPRGRSASRRRSSSSARCSATLRSRPGGRGPRAGLAGRRSTTGSPMPAPTSWCSRATRCQSGSLPKASARATAGVAARPVVRGVRRGTPGDP